MKNLTRKFPIAMSVALSLFAASAYAVDSNPERNAYFGDTHAHSEPLGTRMASATGCHRRTPTVWSGAQIFNRFFCRCPQ